LGNNSGNYCAEIKRERRSPFALYAYLGNDRNPVEGPSPACDGRRTSKPQVCLAPHPPT
jgi:hypothetical protein